MNRTLKTIGSVNETMCICENEATYFQRARAWSMNNTEHGFGLMKRCAAKKEKFAFQLQLCVSLLSFRFHVL